MKEYFDFLIALAVSSFTTDLRDDFETIDLKMVTPKFELTEFGFEMSFQGNDANWCIDLEEKYGNCIFIEVFVPYTTQTIPCVYSKQVPFYLHDEAKVMYDKIIDMLLAA